MCHRVFAIPTILGALATPIFWLIFKDIDKEEFVLSRENEYVQDSGKTDVVAHGEKPPEETATKA